MNPQTPIENLPGVGSYYTYKLNKLEIRTLRDIIRHFPFRYEDFSQVEKIRDVVDGQKISIQGVILQIKNIRTRFGKFLTNAAVSDTSGTIEVIWFNQPYLTKSLKAGTPVSLSGKVKVQGHRTQLMSPTWEIIRGNTELSTVNREPSTLHTGRLVAVYPETEGLTSKWFRAKIALILPRYLEKLDDFLPDSVLKTEKLLPLKEALKKIHQPETLEEARKAQKRLGFDELFLTQLASQMRKLDWQKKKRAKPLKAPKEKTVELIKSLPYELTHAQLRSIDEIVKDIARETPTNRLLEGDVGSGKTVVAAVAAYVTHLSGFDTLIASPTEILAFQHQKTLEEILKPFGVTIGVWTGSKKTSGHVTSGTHALLTTFKPKKEIGLVVVDEQHRFGVAQRAKLFLDYAKSATPHLLTMTATPIPRTLALTLYGDLDLSVLDEMPKGRQKIATFVVPNNKRTDAYRFIEKEVEKGRQAFIITPFVEPSESMQTVKAATEEFEKLTKIFSDFRHPAPNAGSSSRFRIKPKAVSLSNLSGMTKTRSVKLGLLHGRLKSKEKEKIINDFKANKVHILVSTPVVEVGIDVPNATVMMIESAERFGLAQLHQLRGRVGRGEHKSYCLLFTESNSEHSTKRLKSMEKVHIGFELAEIDLKTRGPGEIFGLRQSGFFNFKIADITDRALVSKAQQHAKSLLEKDPNLLSYPHLKDELTIINPEYSQPN